MVHQKAPVNGYAKNAESPVQRTISGLGAVLGAGFDLAELQVQLAKADAEKAAQKIKAIVISAALVFGLMLSALPLLGLGMANFLSAFVPLPLWLSQLIVALAFLIVAGALLMYCFSSLRRLANAFDRSQHAVNQNLRWLRQAVSQISP